MTAIPEKLSGNQLRLWITTQLDPASAAANVSTRHILRGKLDERALERAFHIMVDRHTVLRTSYHLIGGEPVQVVEDVEPAVLSAGPLQDRAQIDTWFAAQVARAFDLTRAPPVRLAVASETSTVHHVVVTVHHIACDELSMQILHKELWSDYDALRRSCPAGARDLAPQYTEWARQQDEILASPRGESLAHFWAEQMEDAPYTELLPDQLAPLDDRSSASAVERIISPDLTARLEGMARAERTSFFTVLQAGLTVLLSHATDGRDIVTGTAADGRSGSRFQNAVGFFTNLLPIRIRLGAGSTARDAVRLARNAVLDALDNRDFPFDSIVQIANPPRVTGKNPLFQVALELLYEDPGVDDSRAHGVEADGLIGNRTTWFDVSLVAVRTASECQLMLSYADQLFSHARMHQLLDAFIKVLEAFVDDPGAPVAALDPFAVPNADPSTPGGPLGTPDPWCRRVEDSARVGQRRTAMVAGGERVSYPQIWTSGVELARRIRTARIGYGAIIAIPTMAPIELATAVLGVHLAGCCVLRVPQESLPDTVARSARSASVGAVLRMSADRVRIECAALHCDQSEPALDRAEADRTGSMPGPNDSAFCVLDPSGAPAAMISHATLARSVETLSEELDLQPGTRMAWTPAAGTGSALVELCAALASGAELDVPPTAEDEYVPFLRDSAIEVVSSPAVGLARHEPGALPHLRTVSVRGGPVPRALRRRWAGPGRRIIGSHTHEEAHAIVAVFDRDDESGPLARLACRAAFDSGRVENAHGHRAALGSPGELVLGVGGGPDRGRTGDAFSLMGGGALLYRGRLKDQLVIRGQNIAVIDLEQAVERSDAVRLAVVVRAEAASTRDTLVAHIMTEDRDVDEAQFRLELRKLLPRHVALPHVRFVRTFPLTPEGTIDREALAARHRQADSDDAHHNNQNPESGVSR